MNPAQHILQKRLMQLNKSLPAQLANPDLNNDQVKKELKRFRKKIVQNKIRNVFIVLFASALSALILGTQYYLHCGLAAFILGVLVLQPTARNTRIVLNSEHKTFVLEIMEACSSKTDIDPQPEEGESSNSEIHSNVNENTTDLEIGYS